MQQTDVKQTDAPSTVAAATAEGRVLDDEKLKQMSWAMTGLGAAVVLGAFLPWATSSIGNASGLEARLGFVTLLCGAFLGYYGYQGLRKEDRTIRHHGWAITAVSLTAFLGLMAWGIVDDLASLGGVVAAGAGLWLTVFGGLGAIYPLVKLRRHGKAAQHEVQRREVSAMAAELAERSPAEASASNHGAHEAGWYDDPMSRHERRYFDGTEWTEYVADGDTQASDPLEQPAT